MKKNIFLTAFFLLSASLFATEESNATIHPLIVKYDKNKDEKIFYTEASEAIQDDFCQYDVNQDGYIDKLEVDAIKEENYQ